MNIYENIFLSYNKIQKFLHHINTLCYFLVFKDFTQYFFFSLQVVKICKECIAKTEPILADTHIYQLRIWSTLSEVQAYLQYFNDAADYSRKMVDGYV